MSTNIFQNAKDAGDTMPDSTLIDAINESALDAIRDAEIHGTKLVIKRNGKIEHLTPYEMRAHIRKDVE